MNQNPFLNTEGEAREKEIGSISFGQLAEDITKIFAKFNTSTLEQIAHLFKNIYQYENSDHHNLENNDHPNCLMPILDNSLKRERLDPSILSVLGNHLTENEIKFFSNQMSSIQKTRAVSHQNLIPNQTFHFNSFNSASIYSSAAAPVIDTSHPNVFPLRSLSHTNASAYASSEEISEPIQNQIKNSSNLFEPVSNFINPTSQFAVSTLLQLSRLPPKKDFEGNEEEGFEGEEIKEAQPSKKPHSAVQFDPPNKCGKRKIAILEKFVSDKKSRESTNLELEEFNLVVDEFIEKLKKKYPNKNEFRAIIGKVYRIHINDNEFASEENKQLKKHITIKINKLFELLITNGKHEKFQNYISKYAGPDMFCGLVNHIAPILNPDLKTILIDTLASTNLNFDSLRKLTKEFASLSKYGLSEEVLIHFFKNVYVDVTNNTYKRTTEIFKKASTLFQNKYTNDKNKNIVKTSLLKLLNKELTLVIELMPSLELYFTVDEIQKINNGEYLPLPSSILSESTLPSQKGPGNQIN